MADRPRPTVARWSQRDMLEQAARGLGKVDRDGLRGLTSVTLVELDAMASLLACVGLVPIPPGGEAPPVLMIPPTKGDRA